MKVQKAMSTRIMLIKPEATVVQAMKRMVENNIRRVMVEPEEGKADYGMVTVRDVVCKVVAKGLDPAQVKVRDIMITPLIPIDKDADLQLAAKIMTENNIAAAPVMEGNKLIGIIAMWDMVMALGVPCNIDA